MKCGSKCSLTNLLLTKKKNINFIISCGNFVKKNPALNPQKKSEKYDCCLFVSVVEKLFVTFGVGGST